MFNLPLAGPALPEIKDPWSNRLVHVVNEANETVLNEKHKNM